MKKLITAFLSIVLFGTSFAQHTLVVDGTISNNGGKSIQVTLDFSDSLTRQIFTVMTDTSGYYIDTLVVPLSGPAVVGFAVASIVDCSTKTIYTSANYSGNIATLTLNLNYCGVNPPAPCQALFSKSQARDSLRNLIPAHLVVTDMSTGSNLQYFWDFGDSTTSTLKNPTHTYKGNGPYVLCLTVSDSNCTSTFCDTLSVDTNGVILRRSVGFTIHVGGYVLGLEEKEAVSFKILPNPVENVLNIQFTEIQPQIINVNVINVSGRLEYSARESIRPNQLLSLDLSALNSGMYILNIQTENQHFNKRFLKK